MTIIIVYISSPPSFRIADSGLRTPCFFLLLRIPPPQCGPQCLAYGIAKEGRSAALRTPIAKEGFYTILFIIKE